ncbi:AEC family transporter [Thermodesulfobacteriota bacterium]
MVINSVLPIFAVIALGSLLKRLDLTSDSFLSTADRLTYNIFFPALLFWKIGTPAASGEIDWTMITAVWCAVFVTFLASFAFTAVAGVSDYQAGSFSQSCYRFSSYVGMAVLMTAYGEEGVRRFGLLIGFVIPFINVLSVVSLIWLSSRDYRADEKARIILKELITNPLIWACLLGVLYSKLNTPFPKFVENTLSLMSLMALPLALVSMGGALTFDKFKGHFTLSLVAAVFKLLWLPLVGYAFLRWFSVSEGSLRTAMIYFALPSTPSVYILSAQLNSDVDLASASVVLSVLLSIVSLSVTLMVFGG